MSTLYVELVTVTHVKPHPNADRLDLAVVKGTITAVPKGTVKAGDRGVYFPPDLLIPFDVAESLGVTNYLKSAAFNDGEPSSKCRVAACRLRGTPSYGFFVTEGHALQALPAERISLDVLGCRSEGDNLNDLFGAKKYEPPVRFQAGDVSTELPNFPRYTSIEHFWRFPDAFAPGEPIRITEKIHGTNSRVGCVKIDGEFQYQAGSHKVNRKEIDSNDAPSIYWGPLQSTRVLTLLNTLCDGERDVVLYGEIFGRGVQDMDYGIDGREGYSVYDIMVDGRFLDWDEIVVHCLSHGVPTVPVLFTGGFSAEVVEAHTHGPTTIAERNRINCGFKGREGAVITPMRERFSPELNGRLILKSVSADYLDRKGATDDE